MAGRHVLNVVVNNRAVQVKAGATLLDAARVAGVHVPTLCYHPRVTPRAVCRLCLVEVEGTGKLMPSCSTPATDGTRIATASDKLQEYRRVDGQLLLSRHPNDCMKCEVAGSCKLQSFVQEEALEPHWPSSPRGDAVNHPEHILEDHTNPAIQRDMSKCIECGLCVDICGAQGQNINAIGFAERGTGTLPVTVFDKPLSETDCISCGQCTAICPVGALVEKPAWHDVLDVLDAKARPTVVQVAPATRIAISEEFGLPPGTVSTGRLTNALRALGFDHVFDTNFAADLTIMEEGSELIDRLQGKRGPLPLFTSCCPGWVNYVEKTRPDLLPHLSTTKSPQQMHGALAKHGPFAKQLAETQRQRGVTSPHQLSPYVVAVMPCTAKKDEALRPGHRGDVDAVVTTRELARMIRSRRVPFLSLSQDGEFDNPLGESTGAAALFGASGGVMEAALRTASSILGVGDGVVDFAAVRGVTPGVKEAEVDGIGRVAVANGIAAAIQLLSDESWRERYAMIEVMACQGGCLGGGGEPKSDDKDILAKRMNGIYAIDRQQPRRKSHENAEVQRLYAEHLEHPLSEEAEKLLHTTYAARGSPREALAKFLSAIDRRDTRAAALLFADDGVWVTHDKDLGTAVGSQAVAELVAKLPKPKELPLSPDHRHRLAHPVEGLAVVTPDGTQTRFVVDVDGSGRITRLEKCA